jgi:hypothetical protein
MRASKRSCKMNVEHALATMMFSPTGNYFYAQDRDNNLSDR